MIRGYFVDNGERFDYVMDVSDFVFENEVIHDSYLVAFIHSSIQQVCVEYPLGILSSPLTIGIQTWLRYKSLPLWSLQTSDLD